MGKAVDEFMAFLKKNTVDTEGIADAITAKFGESVIAASDDVVPGGHVAVKISEFDKIKRDMMDWKNKFRESEKSIADMQSDLDAANAGDDKYKRSFDKLKTEHDRIKPLAKRLMDQQREQWNAISAKIPDTMKERFKYPNDDAELGDDDILTNMEKVNEYTTIGALNIESETETPFPGSPRTTQSGNQPLKGGRPNLADMSVDQKLESGFRPPAK